MASSHSTNGLSQEMEKMSMNSKRHADAPRYMPPHRKYAQATKTSETSTPATSNDRREPTATLSEASSVEGTAVSEDMTCAGSKGMNETETTPTIAQEQPADSEPKPKTTTRSMPPPHNKYGNVSTSSTKKTPAKAPEVAESWEEEAANSDKDDTNTQLSTKPSSATKPTDQNSSPAAAAAAVPKSTYLPPHLKYRSAAPSPPSRTLTPPTSTPPTSRPSSSTSNSTTSDQRRPEKTNMVAHRLIAGALGVKVPRRTEEQRAYDRAIREQEKKKRNVEREAKKKADEDASRAKAAIWED